MHSAVELVSAWGLQPETIISRLSVQLGSRIAYNVDGHEKIGTQWSQIAILKRGYKPSWIGKAPRQRAAARNLTLSALAFNILDTKAQGLLEKEAICKVGHVHEQYVS